ncbi:hypothetical protein ASPZODRAFT_16379 [Penicilliopsis zonata CBS 506.65]|uniref:Uncharacterized protein n=1 Tax=Penicilliopsis zonata CBS 506.65 TaxID=1073090 RepID=A0A1L9SHM7_9EURO|nr:hypothetical protein ASPZODRAFT_16379 [Penicilliopsis zonata CBS 506.65]OJJ46623.1 hypothetical protein ASPZODRAFT_16379 [Penicilliopsis zonata CBS 506.65]
MTAAALPPVPPPQGPESIPAHHHPPPHLNMPPLPRFHPIAINPNPPPPLAPDHLIHAQPFRPFGPPPPLHQEPPLPPNPPQPPPPPPPPQPSSSSASVAPLVGQIDHIESRLRQLEHEEAARMAARSHLLAIRKREDEEFRRVTESAEAEEEDLRRQRKRIKRESMGLYNAAIESPPMRPTPPRRLSETSAATTLAFFKQQSPQEPRPAALQVPLPPAPMPPQHPDPHVGSMKTNTNGHPHHPSHSHHTSHAPPHPPHAPPHPPHASHASHAPPPPPHHHHHLHTTLRRKQKYTIKNVEAWGERHGRPASHDPHGRALWKRPSDGNLVYLTCPVAGCGKADFVTLHGFMCHLTKKHKDRSLGSQSRALEVCGVVFDAAAPLAPAPTPPRASTEDSRLESTADGYQQELDYSSGSEYSVKAEPETTSTTTTTTTSSTVPVAECEPIASAPIVSATESTSQPGTSTAVRSPSTKHSISSIIDPERPEKDSTDNN